MKQIAWYAVLVLLTITGLLVLWQFRQALIIFLLSLATATAFYPVIHFFIERKIPRGVALLISYAIVLALVVGLAWIVSGPLVRELEQITNRIAMSYEEAYPVWLENGTTFQRAIAGLVPPPEALFIRSGEEAEPGFIQGMMSFTTNLAGFFGSLGLILILSLYWSVDRMNFERLLLSLIAVDQRVKVRNSWRAIEKGVGAYIRSELIQSLLAGFFLWLGYRLMGLDYPVLLAFIGALAWLIPWFGAVIAMILPFLVGFSSDLSLGIFAALYTLLVLVVQEFVIEPRIFRRTSYNSIVLVLVFLVLTDAFGLIGLLMAPLLSATIQNIFKFLIVPPAAQILSDETSDNTEDAITLLRKRLEQTKEGIVHTDPSQALNIVSLVERLNDLIIETESYLDNHQPDSRVAVNQR